MTEPFRSGFIAVVGKPNVGKSTLMNRLIGAPISIVTEKPQTTRDRVLGILSRRRVGAPSYQLVFVDTPGLIQPRDLFNRCLMEQAREGLHGADLIYHLIEAKDPDPFVPEVVEALGRSPAEKFLLVNKIDIAPAVSGRPAECGRQLPEEKWLEEVSANYPEVFLISALNGTGLDSLLERTLERMPEGPPYYDEDILTDRDERFIAAEIVRERVFARMSQEVPYSVATQTEEFRERDNGKTYIRIHIFVERETQKAMLIGKGGGVLKQIGAEARPRIEELIGRPVFLELWVKVRKNWRKKERDLQRFGYKRTSGKRG